MLPFVLYNMPFNHFYFYMIKKKISTPSPWVMQSYIVIVIKWSALKSKPTNLLTHMFKWLLFQYPSWATNSLVTNQLTFRYETNMRKAIIVIHYHDCTEINHHLIMTKRSQRFCKKQADQPTHYLQLAIGAYFRARITNGLGWDLNCLGLPVIMMFLQFFFFNHCNDRDSYVNASISYRRTRIETT